MWSQRRWERPYLAIDFRMPSWYAEYAYERYRHIQVSASSGGEVGSVYDFDERDGKTKKEIYSLLMDEFLRLPQMPMTEPSAWTKTQWAMQEAVEKIKGSLEKRQKQLEAMNRHQLRALANDYLLPQDLNRSELIKYIMKKEFRTR